MAGSRLERLGSILTRVQGLLRSGAMKYEDRPQWYDVMKRFPPKINPIFGREKPENEVRPLLYSEDVVRARFFREFTHNPDLVDMTDDKKVLISQRFIEKYNLMMQSDAVSTEDVAFEMARNALKVEGIHLKTAEDIQKEQTEKLKAEAKSHASASGVKSSEATLAKMAFSAADIFGEAAKRRVDNMDDFVDEEFIDSPEVEEMLRAAESDMTEKDFDRKHKHDKSKPSTKH